MKFQTSKTSSKQFVTQNHLVQMQANTCSLDASFTKNIYMKIKSCKTSYYKTWLNNKLRNLYLLSKELKTNFRPSANTILNEQN